MLKKGQKFLEEKNIPLLGQEEIKDLGFEYIRKRRRKLKKWYRLYLSTLVAVICIAVVLLVVLICDIDFSSGGSINPSFDSNSADETQAPKDDAYVGVVDPDLPDSDISVDKQPDDDKKITLEDLYDFDYSKVPEGHTAIIPMDLSLYKNGASYINNSTGYKPNTEQLLGLKLGNENSLIPLALGNAPLVLIVHTHGTEAYSPSGAISYVDDGSEIARSDSTGDNVVSVGAVMSQILNEAGIPTLHCTIMHDSVQYKDSYSRAEATIKEYMARYPSIKLVIDVHRDAVIKSTGELVRPVTLVESDTAAQVMCVVGSDWGGSSCPNWEKNLSLTLKLRETLNAKYTNLCRPTDLRPHTYNQELAKYSLLIEVGACGNSLEEAHRSAKLVAQALAELIPQI